MNFKRNLLFSRILLLLALLLILLLPLAGCFTVSESVMPEFPLSAAAANADHPRKLNLRGFEAWITEYQPIYGYSTVYVPGMYGHRHYHPGHYETIATTSYIANERQTDYFFQRARDRMESAGCILTETDFEYRAEVAFTRLPSTSNAAPWRFTLLLFTAFTCDRDSGGWNARLKIYGRDDRPLLVNDYQQEYSVFAFSPLPIFGVLAFDKTEDSYMQSWCLTALTDKVTSEISAFLSAHPKNDN